MSVLLLSMESNGKKLNSKLSKGDEPLDIPILKSAFTANPARFSNQTISLFEKDCLMEGFERKIYELLKKRSGYKEVELLKKEVDFYS